MDIAVGLISAAVDLACKLADQNVKGKLLQSRLEQLQRVLLSIQQSTSYTALSQNSVIAASVSSAESVIRDAFSALHSVESKLSSRIAGALDARFDDILAKVDHVNSSLTLSLTLYASLHAASAPHNHDGSSAQQLPQRHSLQPLFIGRDPELTSVLSQQKKNVSVHKPTVVLIRGDPSIGIGKTAFGRKVADVLLQEAGANNDWKFIEIDMKSSASSSEVKDCSYAMCECLSQLQPEVDLSELSMEDVEIMYGSEIRNPSAHTVILLDDVDSLEHISALLKPLQTTSPNLKSHPITILITSRRVITPPSSSLATTTVVLQPLSIDESRQLLVAQYPEAQSSLDADQLNSLCTACECNPLAISLVSSSFAKQGPKSLSALKTQLEQLQKQHSESVVGSGGSSSPNRMLEILSPFIFSSIESLKSINSQAVLHALCLFESPATAVALSVICGLNMHQTNESIAELIATSMVSESNDNERDRTAQLYTIRSSLIRSAMLEAARKQENSDGQKAAKDSALSRFLSDKGRPSASASASSSFSSQSLLSDSSWPKSRKQILLNFIDFHKSVVLTSLSLFESTTTKDSIPQARDLLRSVGKDVLRSLSAAIRVHKSSLDQVSEIASLLSRSFRVLALQSPPMEVAPVLQSARAALSDLISNDKSVSVSHKLSNLLLLASEAELYFQSGKTNETMELCNQVIKQAEESISSVSDSDTDREFILLKAGFIACEAEIVLIKTLYQLGETKKAMLTFEASAKRLASIARSCETLSSSASSAASISDDLLTFHIESIPDTSITTALSRIKSVLLIQYCKLLRRIGDVPRALDILQSTTEVLKKSKNGADFSALSDGVLEYGIALLQAKQLEQSKQVLEEGLQSAQLSGSVRSLAKFYNNLANTVAKMGQSEKAEELYEKSLRFRQLSGDRKGEGRTLKNLGESALKRRDFARASTMLERASQAAKDAQDKSLMGILFILRCRVLLDSDCGSSEAAVLLSKAFEVFSSTEDAAGKMDCLRLLPRAMIIVSPSAPAHELSSLLAFACSMSASSSSSSLVPEYQKSLDLVSFSFYESMADMHATMLQPDKTIEYLKSAAAIAPESQVDRITAKIVLFQPKASPSASPSEKEEKSVSSEKPSFCFKPLCSYMLKKALVRGTWERRYVRLTPVFLNWCIHHSDSLPRNNATVQSLVQPRSEEAMDKESPGFVFSVGILSEKSTPAKEHRRYFFCASSSEERELWLKSMDFAVKTAPR